MKMYFARLAGAAAIGLLFAHAAVAQPYPSRQITLIVPFAPGGPADFLGRLIGLKMGEDLGQQVVVDTGRAPTPSSARRRWRRPSPTATRC